MGIGSGTVHTDLNKYPFSQPGFATEFNVVSCFDKQYLGFSFSFNNNKIFYSNWGIIQSNYKDNYFRVERFSGRFFVGADLIRRKGFSGLTGYAGISYSNVAGFGANSSLIWKLPNSKRKRSFYYYSKLDLNYWVSDVLEGYRDGVNGLGDICLSLTIGIEIPFQLVNRKDPNSLK